MEIFGLAVGIAILVYLAGLKANVWQSLIDRFKKRDDKDKK